MGSVTTSIDTALADLKLLYNPKDSRTSGPLARVRVPDSLWIRYFETNIWILMRRLTNLRTFILCVRRLGNDMHLRTDGNNSNKEGSLGFQLVRSEEAVCRNAQEIHLNASQKCIPILMHRLRNLRKFILCMRRSGNDMHLRTDGNNSNKEGSLGSLLVRIEEAVYRNAQKIHHLFHSSEAELFMGEHMIRQLTDCIMRFDSFEKEIEEWYINLTGFLQQSVSPTTDQVMEITNSVLENLVDILSDFDRLERAPVMESLAEMVKFMKNFVRFATLRRVERQQLVALLNPIEAFSVNAAQLSFKYQLYFKYQYDRYADEIIQSETSVLLQNFKPIDPHIYETYTRALTSSKLSRQLHAPISDVDDDPIIIMKDFIDSLVCNLWEMLPLGTNPVVSLKDQPQVLYEGLRLLRAILVKELNKFDENMKDSLGVLICDAGLIIFSLYQKDMKIDIELQDLLERIEQFQKQVEQKDPETSAFNFCRTNELGFIDNFLENLMDVTSSKAGSNAQRFAQTIQEKLFLLRFILVEIVDLHSEQEELRTLWNRALEVTYRVEFLIDHLVVGDVSNSFSVLYDSIMEDINNIKTDASKIITGKRQDIKMNKVTKKSSHVPTQSSAPKIDEVVGFDDESTSITNRLTRGSKQLRIIAIVGMPGQGKTTLATKVYHCNEVRYHFHVRALCSISQVFNRREVLLELLNHIVIELPERCFAMTEQDLAEELQRHLKGNRYLIFLDDIWDIQVWNSLAESLPDDSNRSRIILTSRLRDVAPRAMLDEEPHLLRQLTIDESWELLQRKLSLAKACPPELYELGMQIAETCKGLPLTIVIVAGLLANMEQENWTEILESLSSGILSATGQCMNTLELSYGHLPNYLKPCFLYFGMFPEDQVVSTKKLIWLWIAEGFVQKTKLKCIEDVATDYLMDLIGRSLVLVSDQRSLGGVKACRIHDLLHEFCITKANEGKFFMLLRGYDEFLALNAPRNLWRFSIQPEPTHFREASLFCARVRSLLFFAETEWFKRKISDSSFFIHISKLLRVLDIGQIFLGSLPNEIELLFHLRYLAVQGWISVIPSSIGNLSFLETFIVDSQEMVSFPDTLWNLRKLRHLHVGLRFGVSKGFSFAIENLEDSSDLYELESCSGVIIFSWGSMQKQMKKFANIRKLKCKLFENWDDIENCKRIAVPDFLSRLESLGLSRFGGPGKPVDFEFGLPTHLKKLTLSGFGMPWSKISSIGKLPNLEVLKLFDRAFSGKTWDMGEGEFSGLRFLKLSSVGIVNWTASDDQFPRMQKLVVHRCGSLKEIPSCLENTLTLEMIEVSCCSPYLTSSVKQIQEEQMNMGNSDLKILILPSKK